MNTLTNQKAAKHLFMDFWHGKGYKKGLTQPFGIGLLKVLGNLRHTREHEALAKHVPAVSSAVGKTNINSNLLPSFNLNDAQFRQGWGRNEGFYSGLWLHSDIKDMSYFYISHFFEDLATKGSLK